MPRTSSGRLLCSPVDVLAAAPIAMCTGCCRLFDPALGGNDLTCPHCRSEACDCRACVAGVGYMMLGRWADAGLTRPWAYLSWTADGGIVVDETQKGPRDG